MGGRALGLRLRLTLINALFSSAIVAVLGLVFHETLRYTLRQNTEAFLDEEWAVVKSYLRVEKGRPVWFYDRDDPEETATVLRLRQGLLLRAARQGRVLEVSDAYSQIGAEKPSEIREILASGKPSVRQRHDADDFTYLIRSGIHIDDDRRQFFLSIGRPLESDELVLSQFTRRYLSLAPVLLLALGAASWWAAGRALNPLRTFAAAAQSITGDSLNVRVERRGANDELDGVIDAFNNMVDRLENSFNQIRRFSTDVSHELRTPLTAIRGQLEVALMTSDSKERYRDAMVSAVEDVDRLAQVVRALLHLSQAESGQVAVAHDPLDLARLAGGIAEQFQFPAEAEGLALETRLSPATIAGDKIHIERLLSNLLSNSIKYTPAGGHITLSVVPNDGEVHLIVEDTGRGIPAEHLPHIFDRFYRVPDGHRDPERGLGIGLSFVAWIAKAHSARISVDSEPGKGTRFTVSFAAASQPAATPARALES